jgi:HD-GYP domain-containing protein (c-di-GMP phosphodiesterase class II)
MAYALPEPQSQILISRDNDFYISEREDLSWDFLNLMNHPYIFDHGGTISFLAGNTAEKRGEKKEFVEKTRKAGYLHDIGKLHPEYEDMFRKEYLNPDELEVAIKGHIEAGYNMTGFLGKDVCEAIRGHHPNIFRTDNPVARSIAEYIKIADVFHALTTRNRNYRRPIGSKEAFSIMQSQCDEVPEKIEAFREVLIDLDRL